MDATVDVVTIRRRYRGPPDSANGGYACGLVGRHLQAGARVRLHSPPPLDQPLTIRTEAAGHLSMAMGEQVIADGTPAELAGDIPPPVSFEVATTASVRFRWSVGHPFPGCFVCGPERQDGDGLRIFPGPVTDRSVVAAPWIPDDTVCDPTGHVQVEVLWAALDCPSWFGLLEFEAGTTGALLGQLTARIVRRPVAGETCVALGWARGRDGRKLYGGAALFTSDGTLLGSSDAIWIEPRV